MPSPHTTLPAAKPLAAQWESPEAAGTAPALLLLLLLEAKGPEGLPIFLGLGTQPGRGPSCDPASEASEGTSKLMAEAKTKQESGGQRVSAGMGPCSVATEIPVETVVLLCPHCAGTSAQQGSCGSLLGSPNWWCTRPHTHTRLHAPTVTHMYLHARVI